MLAKCRRCGHLVPLGTARCPGCGLKNPAPAPLNRLFWLVALAAVVLAVVVLAFLILAAVVVALVVFTLAVVSVAAEEPAAAEQVAQRFGGQDAAADAEGDLACPGKETLAARSLPA